jgi:hypothetical protein
LVILVITRNMINIEHTKTVATSVKRQASRQIR